MTPPGYLPPVLVSVVVPMMDEEGSLPLLAAELDALRLSLGARGAVLEVVLVDDGSTDGTAAAAWELVRHHTSWRLLAHAQNRGFGAGFRTGARAARGDFIVSYDADCAYPAADVHKLLGQLEEGADIASATPFVPGGSAALGGLRVLLSRACSLAYRVALRGRATDVHTFTCAFRAYRGPVLRRIDWEADGFLAAAEILSRALLAGARVTEVPSTLRARTAGRSKMRVAATAVAHLGLLVRLRFARGSTQQPAPARVHGSAA